MISAYELLFAIVIIMFDAIGAVALALLLWTGYASTTPVRKLGISIVIVGMVFQALQLGAIVWTGVLPKYTDMPLWSLKDIGNFLWGVALIRHELAKRGGVL